MVPLVYLPTRNQHSQSQLRALSKDRARPAALTRRAARNIHWLWIVSLRIAPTELRLVINGPLRRFSVRALKGALPYVAVCGTVALALQAYRAQKRLWKSDMQAKAAGAAGE